MLGAPATEDKLALFDFCGTFVKFLTTPDFLRFVSRSDRRLRVRYYALRAALRIRLVPSRDSKSHELLLLAGKSEQVIDFLGRKYAQERLIPRLRPQLLALWRKHKEEKMRCVIISGGLDVVLRPVAIYLGADDLICSQLEFKNGVCTGRLAGADNVGLVKVENLRRRYANWSWAQSFAYTDNESDLPLLELVGNPCVIIKARKPPDWVYRRGLAFITVD